MGFRGAHTENDRNSASQNGMEWRKEAIERSVASGAVFFGQKSHVPSLCPYHHHQLSDPLAYKDVNQPKRVNLVVPP